MVKQTYYYLEKISDEIIRFIADQITKYGIHFFILLMGFVFINFYELATFNLSIDEEVAAFGKIEGRYCLIIQQHRWGVFLLESLLFVHTSIPFFPLAVFGIMICSALIVTNISHGNDINKSYYLLFPIFAAFPTWTCMFEFNYIALASGVAIGAASTSVLLFSKYRPCETITKSSVILLFIQTVLNGFAISCYQSFLLFLIANYIGLLILIVMKEDEQVKLSYIVRYFSYIIVIVILSIIFYFIIDYIFYSLLRTWIQKNRSY